MRTSSTDGLRVSSLVPGLGLAALLLGTGATASAYPSYGGSESSGEEASAEESSGEEDEGSSGSGNPMAGGLDLFGEMTLHGRFDANYERRGYTNDITNGRNVFRNYHHFLMLERRSTDDPFYFSAEVVDQEYYHLGARIRPEKDSPWSLKLQAGKMLVPFGPDPLFHQSYGGLAGFDQELLPIIWSELGASAEFQYQLPKGFKVRAETYVVRGHELGEADEVINLQTDFSQLSDVRIAPGGRVSVGWGPISLYYSLYVNKLGFDRTLWMHGLDLTVWGIPDVPVLEDISFRMGFARAQVRGGDVENYYHFGDYVQLRYRPWKHIYFQYRTGIRTMDNRSGFYADESRLGQDDTSTHNLGVMYRQAGFSVGLFHFWRFEERKEKDDDFLRLTVAYDF